MWWLLCWRAGLTIVAAIVCANYAVQCVKEAREVYQVWQTTRALHHHKKLDR
jgi:hypothetical protein